LLADRLGVTNEGRRARALADPHWPLAISLAFALGAEYAYWEVSGHSAVVLLQAAIVGIGLLVAWQRQELLQLPAVLGLVFAFHLAAVLLHIAIGVHADWDPREVYTPQGQALLDGDYPRSEYPLGAVLLFALETLIGDGDAERPNALLMIPFQLLVVAGIWHADRRWGPWLATAVGLWPVNIYFWEFRYDLVPAGLLAIGLAFALRERWRLAGLALALGAFFKWTPGLALVALAAWLLVNRRHRELRGLLVGPVLVVLAHVPFAIGAGGDLAAAYTTQGSRGITAESIWYLPLRALGIVHFPGRPWLDAQAPHWANNLAIAVQALTIATLVAAAAVVRQLRAAAALAALLPVAFLVINRIFSPQFMIIMLTGWAVAAALVLRSRQEQLAFACAAFAAAVLNVLVVPFGLPWYHLSWQLSSLGMFALSVGITVWTAVRAVRVGRSKTTEGPAQPAPPPRTESSRASGLAGSA
jgi:hypothetical protein